MANKTKAVAATITILAIAAIVVVVVVCYLVLTKKEDEPSKEKVVYGDFRVGMTIQEDWVSDLSDKTSSKWKTFVEDFEQNMDSAFGYSTMKDIVNKTTVVGVRKGSIIVDMGLAVSQLFYNIIDQGHNVVKVNLEVSDVVIAVKQGIKELVKVKPFSILSKANLSTITVEKTTEKDDAVKEECVSKTDVVFLLDESGSIGSDNFITLKLFVSSFAASSDVNKDSIQIGVLTFNSFVTSKFSLNQYQSSGQVVEAINRISYSRGGTDIARGISYVSEYSFTNSSGSRTSAAKVLILMTDGESEDASMEARNLRNKGVIIICIGIGGGVHRDHLYRIASRKSLVFPVQDFSALSKIKNATLQFSCDANYTCYGDIKDLQPTGIESGGVKASDAEVKYDVSDIMKMKSCYESAGRANCIHPALIAALASRESRAGRLLSKTGGWGDHGNAYGILQCDKNANPVRDYGYTCTSYDWNSCEHIRMMTAFVLVPNIQAVQQKLSSWKPEQQLQGGVAAYNFGVRNVRTWAGLDKGTTGNDYSNDVIARAQYLVKNYEWDN